MKKFLGEYGFVRMRAPAAPERSYEIHREYKRTLQAIAVHDEKDLRSKCE